MPSFYLALSIIFLFVFNSHAEDLALSSQTGACNVGQLYCFHQITEDIPLAVMVVRAGLATYPSTAANAQVNVEKLSSVAMIRTDIHTHTLVFSGTVPQENVMIRQLH
ncbi:hypothetical protein BU24DRAFT_406423 [Aaosphaeria arxii CBS 175.79]|uniref:Uncharacterized protein n=1 Tax=Aaosphaeria arxii CBS 175.79 TaxID=1450172 RepID=A0A6A5Y5I1_9PLEO|nr:uncharacterized protein BU24DRAFT_406423 [Aaosphaeria arxii CBS 175.79]KAF2019804.1 hypothetical protein BU24DRAFT_406423 [Aaosphaeria arxii CBS 175.79]